MQTDGQDEGTGAFWDYADKRKKAADCRNGVVLQFGGLDEGLTTHRKERYETLYRAPVLHRVIKITLDGDSQQLNTN
jgi:hypothetical protein